MEETINALSLSENNPYYKKYLKSKAKITEEVEKKREKLQKKRLRRAQRKHQEIKVDPYTTDDEYDEDEFLFLSYMTRRYFRDGCYISLIKILFGLIAIIASVVIIDLQLFPRQIRSIAGTLLLGYGIIMIPLSILYTISYLMCFCTYENYISTRTSRLSSKIIHFYNPNTDKFAAVNWANVFSRDKSAYVERKRARGW